MIYHYCWPSSAWDSTSFQRSIWPQPKWKTRKDSYDVFCCVPFCSKSFVPFQRCDRPVTVCSIIHKLSWQLILHTSNCTFALCGAFWKCITHTSMNQQELKMFDALIQNLSFSLICFFGNAPIQGPVLSHFFPSPCTLLSWKRVFWGTLPLP